MNEQVTLLLSFIYVIALTHLLSSTTDLVIARDRVRFSPLLALWMFISFVALISNWLSIRELTSMAHLTTARILVNCFTAILQYFTCSLVSIKIEAHQEIGMPAWFDRQRVLFLGCYALLGGLALFVNYVDRDQGGRTSAVWWAGDIIMLPAFLLIVSAMWVKAESVQWAAALVLLATLLGGLIYFPLSN